MSAQNPASRSDLAPRPRGRRIIVTHADSPLGRRLVKSLYHDPGVDRVLALGTGEAPRLYEPLIRSTERRLRYERVDLARHRQTTDLFRSPGFARRASKP